ncbi:helix-turn-helix domain-containing protein [Filifactor villosus]|uniref:Helix-turn-helix domain-containing protein n=1 Tax=Filifactor villosus TaxID=29374 RepID=A0ABV9QKE3_9FIRM
MWAECFGKRLNQLRAIKGVSARDMSLSLGQSESYINKIENAKSFPSMEMFFHICEYLQVSPKDFFDFEKNDPKLLNEMMIALYKLGEKNVLLIYELIKAMSKE